MTTESRAPPIRFLARALAASAILVSVYGIARISVQLANLLLLLYLAAIGGVGLRALADAVRRRLPVGHGAALGIVLLAIVGAIVGFGFALAPPLQRQLEEARTELPELHDRLDDWLSKVRAGAREATGATPAPSSGSPTGELMDKLQDGPSTEIVGWLATFVGGVGQALGGAALAMVVAVYLAAAPDRYLGGLVDLVPPRYRPRVREVLAELGRDLRAWIVGQVLAMTLVAVVTTLGLWALGVKMALLLGVVAGLADFVPNFGPALAFVPAALVASEDGRVVGVIVLYVAIQIVEGWVLRPLIEQKAVDTLPAVLLATQVLLAALVGFMGLLAAPALIVLVQLVVQRFYVEDVLEARPGERTDPGGP